VEPRLLILETSSGAGFVAVAQGAQLLDMRHLDESRRHARDLAPAAASVLAAASWQPRDINAVVVGRGPGSYTGLRVGIMAAKAFAYATGCAIVGVDTFDAIAQQAPREAFRLDVLADAQQDKAYLQRFARTSPEEPLTPLTQLSIHPLSDWLSGWDDTVWLTGPGLRNVRARLPKASRVVSEPLWNPQAPSVLQIGLGRYLRGERDGPWSLEPLYLRPSSAEEKWDARTTP